MGQRMKFVAVVGLVLILTLGLAGGVLAAGRPDGAGELRWTGVVAFEDGVNLPAKQRLIDNAGGVIDKELEALDFAVVFLPNEAAARALEKARGVRWVEADSYRYYDAQPLPWGVNRIDAEVAWTGSTGAGVNVAVLDTGIDFDHPDLVANFEGGYSAVNRNTSNVNDVNGHGTHTSGTIAAVNNDIGVVGVAPQADLWMVQISKGSRIKLTDIVKGINWCLGTLTDTNPDNNIQVMSMSFGGGYSQSEDDALLKAYNAGIVLVASAGNANGGPVSYPAALPYVVAVSAVDSNNQIASFSSVGDQVDLAAPGVSITSTYLNGGYATMSGTSMAAPHVSGVAALIIASGITDTNGNGRINDEVVDRLKTTAENIGLTSQQQGAGLVDAEKAVLGTTTGNNLP
ncbi:MAG: S8 family peptidase [Chloroflexi bacterium]|nr:S8 family peptidase [Chloroflexota bacterium]